MNSEIVALITLLSSFVGLGGIVILKIPDLVSLPETVPQTKKKNLGLRQKISKKDFFRNLFSDLFLQRILTNIRILSLKTDNKTFNWLQKLRQNSQKRKIKEDNNYWEEVKKATKE